MKTPFVGFCAKCGGNLEVKEAPIDRVKEWLDALAEEGVEVWCDDCWKTPEFRNTDIAEDK